MTEGAPRQTDLPIAQNRQWLRAGSRPRARGSPRRIIPDRVRPVRLQCRSTASTTCGLAYQADDRELFSGPVAHLASRGAFDPPHHFLGAQPSFYQRSATYDCSPAGLTTNRNFTIVRSRGFRDRAPKMFSPWMLLRIRCLAWNLFSTCHATAAPYD